MSFEYDTGIYNNKKEIMLLQIFKRQERQHKLEFIKYYASF